MLHDFFFFQAEDGIRDVAVTGVQTCALPILGRIARHMFSSQYIRVAGNPTYVLASDNCYMYQNLESHTSISTTFDVSDRAANVAAQDRMVMLAGSKDRVVPGHDALQFKRFPTQERVAKIK